MKPKQSPEERFWGRVERRGPDECWPWTLACDRQGYGRTVVDGRDTSAHRNAYRLHYGQDPGELCVCHKCDNPPCCNPAHLFLGDQQDNVNDKVAKGRSHHPTGAKNPTTILTEDQVREIRRLRATTDLTIPQIAARYGVALSTVSHIIQRRNWPHID